MRVIGALLINAVFFGGSAVASDGDVVWRYCTSELLSTFTDFKERVMEKSLLPEELKFFLGDESSYKRYDLDELAEKSRIYFSDVTDMSALYGRCADGERLGVLFLKIKNRDPRFSYLYVVAMHDGGKWMIKNATKETESVRVKFEMFNQK